MTVDAPRQPRWIEYLPLDELRPHPDNPKEHSLDDLRASFDRFDFTEPHLVDERTGLLISGHGRREVLLLLRDEGQPPPDGVLAVGDTWEVPVVRGWSSRDDDEARAYLVAANQLTTAGGFDDPRLSALLNDLAAGPGLLGTGFHREQVEALDRLVRAIDWETGQGTNPYDEWRGVPEYEMVDTRAYRIVKVLFGDADAVAAFEAATGMKLPDQRVSQSWFPPRARRDLSNVQWEPTADGG